MARFIFLIVAGALAVAGGRLAAAQDATIVRIDDATYGVEEAVAKRANCGEGLLDVSVKLRGLCIGQTSCRIAVHNASLGGDPCKGASKMLDIGYTCSDGSVHAATCNEANEMLILCPSSGAPEGGFDCAYDASLEQGK